MPEKTITEIELKLRLLAGDGEGVFSLPAIADILMEMPQEEHLEAWYFDTADGALRQAGLAYRIRREAGGWIATVKADEAAGGGLFTRREWNVAVDRPETDIGCFSETEAGPFLAGAVGDEALVRLFATVFTRRRANVGTADGSVIEVAVDLGEIVAGDAREPIGEIELELKDGSPAAVLRLGAELARTLPLAVEARSKYLRALVLAGLVAPMPAARYSPPPFDTNAAAGLAGMLVSQLAAVFAAYERFRDSAADIEAPHKLRVQLRRLRCLLAFAKPLADPGQYGQWRDDLQSLGRLTNDLRELDVVIGTWRALLAESGLVLSPPPWLGLMLESERGQLAAATAGAIEAARPTATLLAFWAAVAGGDLLPAVETPFAAFAAGHLADWLAAIRETGKNLPPEDIEGLHRLRIRGKKLRYVLESLPWQDRRTSLLILRLRELQDCLGQRVDSRTAAAAMASWSERHASRVVHRDAGLFTGWSARLGIEATSRYETVWRRFRRAARRWLKDAKIE